MAALAAEVIGGAEIIEAGFDGIELDCHAADRIDRRVRHVMHVGRFIMHMRGGQEIGNRDCSRMNLDKAGMKRDCDR